MSAPKPRIALTAPLFSRDADSYLVSEAEVLRCYDSRPSVDDLAFADAVIAQSPRRIGRAELGPAEHLTVISTVGSGYDFIDVGAATDAGVAVTNAAGVASVPVAEYVIGAVVLGRRKFLDQRQRLLAGDFREWRARYDGVTASGVSASRLGIVGLGRIGAEIARRAELGLGMEVRYVGSGRVRTPAPSLVEAASVDELCAWADVITLHVPLTATTRHLIGPRQLEMLGGDGLLINTARGGVVDQCAVLTALRAGTLGGAVLDVLDPEPPDSEALLEFSDIPGLFVTPHIAGVTRDSLHALSFSAVERALTVLRGEKPPTLVNPQVWKRRRRYQG
ncbi:2-hydroxyacid dehydrogenase [Saccharopolyspora spinosa]|uniref:Gluconate 2-dehydrogenase n=1 Tax=Saccharopolyspora spinosa TaxID=60894 RepID=A0A2N3Y1G7_SACSN|nr:2-hydroxyacid dehydrogenase [Saccharopolyspora spinosa]PKW16784.1 gluconate 2-dehydrogenase [Saccharopolyspora spinosa]